MNPDKNLCDRIWPFSIINKLKDRVSELEHSLNGKILLSEHDYKYLLSRDALCSSLANKANALMFDIAKLKGAYDKK